MFPDLFESLPFPMDEGRVSDAIESSMKLRRFSRLLHEGNFAGPFKTGLTILLVDDSSSLKKEGIDGLRAFDCDVKTIEDLKLLYDSFVWSTPDVILIDENTQEIDALTVCKLLNMHRELSGVPKILLSRHRGQPDRTDAHLFSSILKKPFTPKQLLSRLHLISLQMVDHT